MLVEDEVVSANSDTVSSLVDENIPAQESKKIPVQNVKIEGVEDSKIIRGLTTFVGAGLVVFGVSSWNLFDIYQGFRSISERNFRLGELGGQIVYFDEALTMSVRMGAATGDPQWEKRYLSFDPQLIKALDESAKIAPEAYQGTSAEVTDANNQLVELEKRSFDLVRQGKRTEAAQVLNGSEYAKLKKIYADGSAKTLETIAADTNSQLQAFSQRLFVSLIFTALSLPALIAAYTIALKLIRAYLNERDQSQQNIATLELQQSASQQERERSEALQRELISLLSDVEGAVSGDLTVRAQITAGEIGIVADFFNAIVESLRDVVTQVKQATLQVNTSVNTNNESIRNLADEATLQSEQLNEALQSVQQITESIQQVASSAQEAADASNEAAATAEVGSIAIAQSASSILQLRQTVAETTKKVKRLGEASQQISKVVVLIDQIALKTNMLAVNASIEAARAGEEGRGFAVVAEEVGALAAQSATATKEIARIVETIQRETTEVVESMEASTLQVVEGTDKVEDARKSLVQIVEVAKKVNELFQGISIATTSQVATSQSVKLVMENLSTQSQKSSETSREVSIALQETANVASKLQASVETFKVEAA